MRQGEFGVYSFNRRFQTAKLQFYIKVIITEATAAVVVDDYRNSVARVIDKQFVFAEI